MTDNKRFTLAYENGNWWAVRDWDITLWKEEVIHLLNELNDENVQLKQFKENVIRWVDSQMKFNVKKYIETEDPHFKSENIDLHNFKVFIGIDSND